VFVVCQQNAYVHSSRSGSVSLTFKLDSNSRLSCSFVHRNLATMPLLNSLVAVLLVCLV
jgi:hypothetical protein